MSIVTLNDVCELIVDCPHSTATDEGIGYPLVRTPNIGKGRLVYTGMHRVCKEVYDKRNQRAIPQKDDLIFAREATAGNVAIIRQGEEVCLGQRTVLIRPNKTLVNPMFLTYFLLAPLQQYNLLSSANGATVAHVNLPTIRNLKIDLPPLEIQNRIASILSRYDDLIENYQHQIQLLEEAAQRLYKEWFVDLHFPGYENTNIVDGVPEGWEKKSVGEFCNVFTGKKNANAKVDKGKYKFFTCGENPVQIDSFVFDGPAIIISGNGSYTGRTTFYEGKFDLYQRTYACTWKKKDNPLIIYGLYQIVRNSLMDLISGGTHGAAIPYIIMSDITDFKFIFNEDIMLVFSKKIKSILDTILNYKTSIEFLTEARDRLLPKLMSGEITV